MDYNELSGQIIGASIEVHRALGPGLLESVYEEALCFELSQREIRFQRHAKVLILYKGMRLATDLRLDLIVEEAIIVEGKAKEIATGLSCSPISISRIHDLASSSISTSPFSNKAFTEW